MSELLKSKMFLAAGVGIGASAIAAWYYHKFKKDFIPPTKWKRIGILDDLCYFPFKSCSGLPLNSGNCDDLGIRDGKFKDRQFMLVDQKDNLVNAQTYPNMLKIHPKVIESDLYATAPGMEPIKIDFSHFTKDGKSDIRAKLFEVEVYVTECGIEYDKWFSNVILGNDEGLRLVYYPFPVATKARDPAKELDTRFYRNEDTGSLQNVSSYMLINNSSVEDLNTRLQQKVHFLAFRGNFLVKTDDQIPYAEDKWKWIKIGDEVILRQVAACYRCTLTNIDPFSAERNSDFQPLKTLKKYRMTKISKSPVMGVQLGVRKNGLVRKGDIVYIEDV